jgi:hypothetical protein
VRQKERRREGEWAFVGREETIERERESGLMDGGWEKEEMETSI